MLCENYFASDVVGPNSYSSIPFDVSAFPKKCLLLNEKFISLFLSVLSSRGITIRSSNDDSLYTAYDHAVKKYRKSYSLMLYKESIDNKALGRFNFDEVVFVLLSH